MAILPLLLLCSQAGAGEGQTSQVGTPRAREEVASELEANEKVAFDQLQGSIDPIADEVLFSFLDNLPIGRRGAFVGALLKQTVTERSNTLGFLARLDDAQRQMIADLIRGSDVDDDNLSDQPQWPNFFHYVGSVSPDESVSKIFDHAPHPPFMTASDEPELIFAEAKDGDPDGSAACVAKFDPATCRWDFWTPGPEVTGGEDARETPWQAQLYLSDKAGAPYTNLEIREEFDIFGKALSENQRQHSCGGILIPGGWVLTAAHCIWDDPRFGRFIDERRVRTGTEDLTKGGTTWRITALVRHAGYNGPKKNDIALLKIAADSQTNVSENGDAHPIALPIKSVPDGVELLVTGWGATGRTGIGSLKEQKNARAPTSYLREAGLKKVSLSRCNDDPHYKANHFQVQEGQVCALGDDGRDTCQGDSGGPLVYYRKGRATLVGIVSFGPGCGMDNTPGVYTDVNYYRGWILGAMKQAKPNQELVWQEGSVAKPFH